MHRGIQKINLGSTNWIPTRRYLTKMVVVIIGQGFMCFCTFFSFSYTLLRSFFLPLVESTANQIGRNLSLANVIIEVCGRGKTSERRSGDRVREGVRELATAT